MSHFNDIEAAVAREARTRVADGMVCGHVHHTELREIEGVLCANDGDGVENLTALTEHHDARLDILDWCARQAAMAARPADASPADADPAGVPA